MIFKYGKHKGMSIKDVPDDYLDWMLRSGNEQIEAATKELTRRQMVMEANMGMIDRIIAAGYRTLSKQLHPDIPGGDHKQMQALTAAYEAMKQARGAKT